ncbi:MAG: radical SAM family heme chaperone HemW [Clostridia bacterium]|nr:radical SAM family heme chaperone HemW [Clostridia bacterium]
MTDSKPVGLYIHVPFCKSKCPYCDFYSVAMKPDTAECYVKEVIRRIREYNLIYDTVYFGGGTPSLLGSDRIAKILGSVYVTNDCEITVECNPSDICRENTELSFGKLRSCGVNRISMGLQSADDGERRSLGRRTGRNGIERAIRTVKAAGINNISLDIMLGIPGQTEDSLAATLGFCIESGVKHISAYILKIEENTFFGRNAEKLSLPDEDRTADFYLQTVETLGNAGFEQYEISNFALPGYESRHNLKYWNDEEYLGTGPAAHSFLGGKRFYFERNLEDYLGGAKPVSDGIGGTAEEYIMLILRLKKGLDYNSFKAKFGCEIPDEIKSFAALLAEKGLAQANENGFHFTPEGFLISNKLIYETISKLSLPGGH